MDMEYEEEEYANVSDDDGEYTYEEEDDDGGMFGSPRGNTVNPTSEKGAKAKEMKDLVVPSDSYIIKDASEIAPLMNSMIREVSGLLELSPDLTQSLLQFYKWDKERLIDAFFADPEKVKRDACLDQYSLKILSSPKNKLRKGSGSDSLKSFKCRICCDDCPMSDSFSIGCGHLFCTSCYREYLRSQIGDGPTCVIAHCPEPKCKQIITNDIFRHLLLSTSPETAADFEKYESYYLRNFIEKCKNMRYCPAPRCNKVSIGSCVTLIRCSCGHPYCFRCGEESHDPCGCAQLSEWSEKCQNESETANWIIVNTHKCPSCLTRIEKNQGCNHMTCRVCKHEFCWICSGPWTDHNQASGGYYKCNKFDATASKDGSAAAQAKAELDRYLHYYQRYHGHENALKFASQQRAETEKRMVESQNLQKSSWIDVQFLKQATEQVIECRRVLKYTYVLGFFLKDQSAEKELFEHHQEMLEKNTEKLQELIEKPIDKIDRTQVVNLTRVTEKFMASLLATMSGGVVILEDSVLPGTSSTPAKMSADTASSSSPNVVTAAKPSSRQSTPVSSK